jgi:hypothetical protein
LTQSSTAFVIQNAFTTTSQYSASFSYNPSTRTTGAFVHGLCESEISALVNKLVTRKDLIVLPMALPLYLMTFRADSARAKVGDSHREIIEIEHQTGIRTKWHPGKACCGGTGSKIPGQRRYDGVNFDEVTADLTSLTSKLAYVEFVCEVHLPMLDSFDVINKRLLDMSPAERRQRLTEAEHRFRTESGLLRSSLSATFSRAKYLSQRAQVQVQTVSQSDATVCGWVADQCPDLQPDSAKGQCAEHEGQCSVEDHLGGPEAGGDHGDARQRGDECDIGHHGSFPSCHFYCSKW